MPGVNARWLVGKTIKAVHLQKIPQDPSSAKTWDIQTIQQMDFTDGSRLVFHAAEMADTDPQPACSYIPAKRPPPKPKE